MGRNHQARLNKARVAFEQRSRNEQDKVRTSVTELFCLPTCDSCTPYRVVSIRLKKCIKENREAHRAPLSPNAKRHVTWHIRAGAPVRPHESYLKK